MENDFKEYFKKTERETPSGLVRKFFGLKYNRGISGNEAIDLGCGTGNDTEFLVSKGYKVLAIDDKEEVKEYIEKKGIDEERYKLVIDDFSKMDLPHTDLLLANMSLFFVTEDFDTFMKNTLDKINPNGFIVANFLGKDDGWKESKTTVSRDELIDYLEGFDIKYFSEETYFKDTARGTNKLWNVYTVIAQKVEKPQ